MTDIEKELIHYVNHFKDKTVFCNCHDDEHSNFFRYFMLNFENFGLKRLLATHFEKEGQSYFFDVNRDNFSLPPRHIDGSYNWDKLFTLKKPLRGNGDFRSQKSIDILKRADIVVTNPTFSLFREYMAQLIQYNKKFLIIGNINAVTYKDIFPLIKENKVWLGSGGAKGNMEFQVPESYSLIGASCKTDESGQKCIKMCNVRWFTNLDVSEHRKDLVLYKHYNPKDYPKYDNYDAINVDKTVDIPVDYYGVIGVPITFLDKYNPFQFEIVNMLNRYILIGEKMRNEDIRLRHSYACNVDGKAKYARVLIKWKTTAAITS